jgi:hypothetical protein
MDATQIGDKPYLREHTVVFDPSVSGRRFRYKMLSRNEIGSTESVIGTKMLASIPATPLNAPVSDPSVTSVERVKVIWDQITADGSSAILSYSLEIDDGVGGDLTAVVGV